jgi:hypothetical protein
MKLLECTGFDALWVVVDRHSKMRLSIPCHMTMDAVGLARLSSQKVVWLHGFPATIVSNPELQFTTTSSRQIFDCLESGL